MTKVKSIWIQEKNVQHFNTLNEMTPDDMSFSKQVGLAVKQFVETNEDKPFEEELPAFDAPIEEWIGYLPKHPEHKINIAKRYAQLGNLLKRELNAL